jgi:hypothetical protein
VLAPLAVRTPELPAQIVAEFTLTDGVVFTETVEVAIPEQMPFVPVTVYTVVEEGLTTILLLVDPVLQL